MVKINLQLLPIKLHYFCFMAALGPILPFLNVFGKQLGIPTEIIGTLCGVLPIAILLFKPVFGWLVDRWYSKRKLLFISLILGMGFCFTSLYFIRFLNGSDSWREFSFRPNVTNITCEYCPDSFNTSGCNTKVEPLITATCSWSCDNNEKTDETFAFPSNMSQACLLNHSIDCSGNCQIFNCIPNNTSKECLYTSVNFWLFVLLMSIGSVAFNVANSISDAICFDLLGENGQMKYGQQRVWGTLGFGTTAFLGGFAIELYSPDIENRVVADYTPAFLICLIFTILDILVCLKLKLPKLTSSDSILRDVGQLIKKKKISVFLVFATLVGFVDSFIIYFLLWFLEDLAIKTDYIDNIKLLQGLTLAAETLVGEVIFFPLSGAIISRLGYGHTLTVCFLAYMVRLFAISFIPNPWWVLPIELIMQGPSYALVYSTIVAYASAIAPPGTSATVQGLVAGMDDGLGYALGSVTGGFLYPRLGDRFTFRAFALLALLCAIAHFLAYKFITGKDEENKVIGINVYYSPEKAAASTENHNSSHKV